MKKILSVFLAAVMVSSVASLRSLADTASAADEGSNTVAWQGDEDDYGEYLNEISQLPSAVTDVTLNNENTTRLESGENLYWQGIIDEARTAGVKYFVVEQDDCQGRDPFECLEKSYNYLREIVK